MNRHSLLLWIVFPLAIIGLISPLFGYSGHAAGGGGSLQFLLLPILLIGILYYAMRRSGTAGSYRTTAGKRIKVKPSKRTQEKVAAMRKQPRQTQSKRKSYPFQVIEGSKGKNDDQMPKYH